MDPVGNRCIFKMYVKDMDPINVCGCFKFCCRILDPYIFGICLSLSFSVVAADLTVSFIQRNFGASFRSRSANVIRL